jgi:glycosyltransferase involved in cell wall biosynthesis
VAVYAPRQSPGLDWSGAWPWRCEGRGVTMKVAAVKPDSSPKVIVYTRAFNSERTIGRAIESIIAQTHNDFEYYLVDNGSMDRTRIIMEEYAERDGRLRVMGQESFSVKNSFDLFQKKYPDNYYLCFLDADDEYKFDFLEKTFEFAQNNNLDIAVAGSDYIDSMTGHVLQQKTIKDNMIIEGRGFADDFLHYRSYINAFWNKLYKHTVVNKLRFDKFIRINFCEDSIVLLTSYLKHAKRVGFLAQSLHKYYIYPSSLSRHFDLNRLDDCHIFFRQYKNYLRRFGPISSINMDYLCAIWLGWMDDFIFKPLCGLDLSAEKKLSMLSDVFASSVTKDMLRRDADPRFRNLVARDMFLQSVCAWMYAQEESKVAPGRVAVAKILKNMDACPGGPRREPR